MPELVLEFWVVLGSHVSLFFLIASGFTLMQHSLYLVWLTGMSIRCTVLW